MALLFGLSTDESHGGIVAGVEGVLQTVVGTNIRRVRKDQGMSQEAFGESVGWHRTFVGAVERGERNLTLKTVERVSDQLGIHPIDLLWDRASLGLRFDTTADLHAAEGPPPTGPATGPRHPRPGG